MAGDAFSTTERLIEALYEGPLEEVPFHSFLTGLCQALAAVNATLILRPPGTGAKTIVFTEGEIRGWENPYAERFFALDPFSDLPEGEVKSLLDLVHPDALMQSEFYKEFLAPSDTFHVLGFDVRCRDGLEAALRATRGKRDQAFATEQYTLLDGLVSHLRRVARLYEKIAYSQSRHELLSEAVDELGIGIVVLDDRGRVLRTNRVAGDRIDRREGFQVRENRLCSTTAPETETLHRCVERVIETGNEERALGALIRPMPAADWYPGTEKPALAIVLLP